MRLASTAVDRDGYPRLRSAGARRPEKCVTEEDVFLQTEDKMSAKPKKLIKHNVRLLVAALLLAYVFLQVPLADVVAAIRTADARYLALVFLISIAVQFVGAFRLNILLNNQGMKVSVRKVFEISFVSRFYSLFLPGGSFSAIAVNVYKLTHFRANTVKAGVALLMDRLSVTLVLCVLGIGFWFVQESRPDSFWLMLFLGTTFALILLICVLMSSKLPCGRLKELFTSTPITNGLASLMSSIQKARQIGAHTAVVILICSIAVHLLGTLGYWVLCHSLGIDLSPSAAGWLRSVMLLLALLPISIAGFGLRELGALAVLQLFGIEPTVAIAFALLIMTTTVLGIGLVGGVLESWRFAKQIELPELAENLARYRPIRQLSAIHDLPMLRAQH